MLAIKVDFYDNIHTESNGQKRVQNVRKRTLDEFKRK